MNGSGNRSAQSAPAPSVHSLRRPRGVRRRRDDLASAVEIEELDSDVMRQNSYNYFQRHDASPTSTTIHLHSVVGNPNEGSSDGTTVASSRKRQRTLAEQLEELCLNGASQQNSSKMSGAAAAAACRQAWNRVFANQMAAAQQRAAAAKAAKSAAAAASAPPLPAPVSTTPATNVSNVSGDVDMDAADYNSAASSAAEDGDLDESDDESGRDSGSFKVFGGVPDVKGLFFTQGASRQRPMERMFRHYVTMAAERSNRSDAGTPRGDELVLFQQGPTSLEFPYSLFTPEQVEDLRARHNRKKKRAFGRMPLGSPSNSRSDQSWRFQELDSSDEADVSSSAEDSDMDTTGDHDTKAPQLAGALSHGEWFAVDDDDIDDDL